MATTLRDEMITKIVKQIEATESMKKRIIRQAKKRAPTPDRILTIRQAARSLRTTQSEIEDIVECCDDLELIVGFGVNVGSWDLEGGDRGIEYVGETP